jgi:DNA mismatch repair protein MSH5
MASASRPTSTSRRSTPWASLKRPAKSQEGQRKQPRPEQPPSRLRDGSEPAQPALSAERLDAEIRADEAADEALDHVIMAIDIRDRDTVGCAYYVAREQSLRCMEDVTSGGKEALDICQYLPV